MRTIHWSGFSVGVVVMSLTGCGGFGTWAGPPGPPAHLHEYAAENPYPLGYADRHHPDVMPSPSPPPGPIGNEYDLYRQYPHRGYRGHAAAGHPNYDLPNPRYDVWYRPRGLTWTKTLRCVKPPLWRPRGFGWAFNEPTAPDRLDYHRHVLQDPYSGYGPSYYMRRADQRCPCLGCIYAERCLEGDDGDDRDGCELD